MNRLKHIYHFARSLPKFLGLAWCLARYRATNKRNSLDIYIKSNAIPKNAPFWYFLHYISLRNLGILNFSNFVESGEQGFVEQCLFTAAGKSPLVIDVGANHGQFAGLVLQASSHSRVLSFEANPKAAEFYSHNHDKDLRFTKRASIICKAISNVPAFITLYDYSSDAGSGHASVNKEVFDGLCGVKDMAAFQVEATTLDRELEGHEDISNICLVKFDIEGHELEAIQGSMKALADAGFPPVLIEFNEMNAVMGSSFYKIRKMLGSKYKPYRLLPRGNLLPLEGCPSYDTEIYAYQNIVFVRTVS